MSFEQNSISTLDKVLRTEIDVTTDVNFTFIAETFNATASTSLPVWRVYRVTNATGSIKFPIDPDSGKVSTEDNMKASLMATYTY